MELSNEKNSFYEESDLVTRREFEDFKTKLMNDVHDYIRDFDNTLQECLKNQKQITEVALEASDFSLLNKEKIMKVSELLELLSALKIAILSFKLILRKNFDTNLQASIKASSNLIESLKIKIDNEFEGIKKDLNTEVKLRNGLESRIDKNINLLKGQINTLIEKSATFDCDFAKIQAEFINLDQKVNELSQNDRQHQDEIILENYISKDELISISNQILKKINDLDTKVQGLQKKSDKKFEDLNKTISNHYTSLAMTNEIVKKIKVISERIESNAGRIELQSEIIQTKFESNEAKGYDNELTEIKIDLKRVIRELEKLLSIQNFSMD